MNKILVVGASICFGILAFCVRTCASAAMPSGFDIREFALPNCAPGEIRFEEPRDIEHLVLPFADSAPATVIVSYLQEVWPHTSWKKAQIEIEKIDDKTLLVSFKKLNTEGIKVDAPVLPLMDKVQVFAISKPTVSALRVELDAGRETSGSSLKLSGYNARINKITPESGTTVSGATVTLASSGRRCFTVEVTHTKHDEGNLTFARDQDTFTISLDALAKEGPIWFEDQGIYITSVNDKTSFAGYKAACQRKETISEQVLASREQSLGGSINGQPRPHMVAFHLGCKRAQQRFWLEMNGDVVMRHRNLDIVEGRDTKRFKNEGKDYYRGDARFLFGLERWNTLGRFPDATQMAIYTIMLRNGDIELEQKSLASPLYPPANGAELAGDDTIVALIKFRFRNTGTETVKAELPIAYSSNSCISRQLVRSHERTPTATDDLVPIAKEDPLSIAHDPNNPSINIINSNWKNETVLRGECVGNMTPRQEGGRIVLWRELKPGERCEVVLKVPYIALDTSDELAKLAAMDFAACERDSKAFWQAELRRGAQVKTPEPRLNLWHYAHLGHVQIADTAMPGQQDLISTSPGTSIYANYCNEACMIIQDLDERGLYDEARRRLNIWIKYQGTEGLAGNFTDHNGVFFGAGGFQAGASYNQHHGWVLWCLANHYFESGDKAWLMANADSLIAGADWVFRQRKNTMKQLPNSRGWEYGFLPAGGLEDVADYAYWLSTNTWTWRGTEWAARALEDVGHPQAARIRAESDAYRNDLIKGFEKARQYSPLVKLLDGRWVPNYPSRLYRRGRDGGGQHGWIREVLEGSVNLLISGLYDSTSKQAGWILDDYQDNRYPDPSYSYPTIDKFAWFYVYGFSWQPNLLAGLMPYLDRDEPDVYIWMFFNAWASCYHEEINGLSEAPMPVLGYSTNSGIKTSDESNPSKWLRYMFVYPSGDTLYLGRAIPREWFKAGKDISVTGASTPYGIVSVNYQPTLSQNKITLTASLSLRRSPGHIIARFRHPDKLPVKSVTVNGQNYSKFDAVKGDVDLSGLSGKQVVEALY
jgi:hypothetical protein